MNQSHLEHVKPSFDFVHLPVPNGPDAEPTGDLDEDSRAVTFADVTDKLRYLTHLFEGPRDDVAQVNRASGNAEDLALEIRLRDSHRGFGCSALVAFRPAGGDWTEWLRLAETQARGAEAEINADLGSRRFHLTGVQIVRKLPTLDHDREPIPGFRYVYPGREDRTL